jgi:hypothetical protein
VDRSIFVVQVLLEKLSDGERQKVRMSF